MSRKSQNVKVHDFLEHEGKALPLIIGTTLTIMLILMIIMAKVGHVIKPYQETPEEIELNNQRRNDARMERILISTTSLA